MAPFLLGKDPVFPPAHLADRNGLLAIGGDLSITRLVNAYSAGIFPWYSGDDPILWWSPDPRMVLFPRELHISKSMTKLLKKKPFKISMNENFEEVVYSCREQRPDEELTWITADMAEAYTALHYEGYAHSVEVFEQDTLVGGFYGLALGKCFFGESMFFHKTNASKYGFIKFAQKLAELKFLVIDCQVKTKHLASLGAREIPRIKFLEIIKSGLRQKPLKLLPKINSSIFS